MYKNLLLQSFLVSTLDFQSNSIMKSTIFPASPLSFLLVFNLVYALIFNVFFHLDSRELSRETRESIFRLSRS